jgi:DedD protein
MDHELKQRLIGALVVTILSAIFIPMLFDDPIEEEGQAVTTLALPSENQFVEEPAIKAPASSEQILAIPQQPQIEVAALAPSTTPAATNSLRPDEMDETPTPKLQPKPIVKPPVAKPHVEKPAYSETTNYGVSADEVDDEPPMKPKVKKVEEDAAKKGRPEEELLKQMRAAKLLEGDGAAIKTVAPVDASVTDVKKVLTSAEPKKTSRWYIQVGSFSNKAKADGLLEGLRGQGLPAVLTPIQNEKGTFYRLRVGPELDGKVAAAMKKKMDDQHITSILVSE